MHYIKVQHNPDGTRDNFICNPHHEVVYKADSMAALERKLNVLNGGLGLVPHEYFAAQAIAGLAAGGGYAGNPAGLAEDALNVGGYMVDLMNRRMKQRKEKDERKNNS